MVSSRKIEAITEIERQPRADAGSLAQTNTQEIGKSKSRNILAVLGLVAGGLGVGAVYSAAEQTANPGDALAEGCVVVINDQHVWRDPCPGTGNTSTPTTRPRVTTTTKPRTSTTKPKPKPSTTKPSNGGGSGGSGNGGSNGGSKTTQNASPTTTTAPELSYEDKIRLQCAGQAGEPRLAETLYNKRFHKDRAGEVVSVDGNGEVVIIAKYCDLVFVEPKTPSEGIDTNYGQIFRYTRLDDELNAGQAGALDAYARSKWAEENAPAVNGFKAAVDGATKIGVDGLSKANLYPIDAGAISRFNAREL